jgi:hypothetical protein
MQVNELANIVCSDPNIRAVVLFVVQRSDCFSFRPCHESCPLFAAVLKHAHELGIQVLAHDVRWTESGKCFLGKPLPVEFGEGVAEVDKDWLQDVLDAAVVVQDGRIPTDFKPKSAFLNTRLMQRSIRVPGGKQTQRGKVAGSGKLSGEGAKGAKKGNRRRACAKASMEASAQAVSIGVAAADTECGEQGGEGAAEEKKGKRKRASAKPRVEVNAQAVSVSVTPADRERGGLGSEGAAQDLSASRTGDTTDRSDAEALAAGKKGKRRRAAVRTRVEVSAQAISVGQTEENIPGCDSKESEGLTLASKRGKRWSAGNTRVKVSAQAVSVGQTPKSAPQDATNGCESKATKGSAAAKEGKTRLSAASVVEAGASLVEVTPPSDTNQVGRRMRGR